MRIRLSGERTRTRVLFSAPRRKALREIGLGEDAERGTRGACAPQTSAQYSFELL
jgi:hypothetical protein